MPLPGKTIIGLGAFFLLLGAVLYCYACSGDSDAAVAKTSERANNKTGLINRYAIVSAGPADWFWGTQAACGALQ